MQLATWGPLPSLDEPATPRCGTAQGHELETLPGTFRLEVQRSPLNPACRATEQPDRLHLTWSQRRALAPGPCPAERGVRLQRHRVLPPMGLGLNPSYVPEPPSASQSGAWVSPRRRTLPSLPAALGASPRSDSPACRRKRARPKGQMASFLPATSTAAPRHCSRPEPSVPSPPA